MAVRRVSVVTQVIVVVVRQARPQVASRPARTAAHDDRPGPPVPDPAERTRTGAGWEVMTPSCIVLGWNPRAGKPLGVVSPAGVSGPRCRRRTPSPAARRAPWPPRSPPRGTPDPSPPGGVGPDPLHQRVRVGDNGNGAAVHLHRHHHPHRAAGGQRVTHPSALRQIPHQHGLVVPPVTAAARPPAPTVAADRTQSACPAAALTAPAIRSPVAHSTRNPVPGPAARVAADSPRAPSSRTGSVMTGRPAAPLPKEDRESCAPYRTAAEHGNAAPARTAVLPKTREHHLAVDQGASRTREQPLSTNRGQAGATATSGRRPSSGRSPRHGPSQVIARY